MSVKATGFPPVIRDAILLRDGGLCAMLGAPGCDGRPATEANHRRNRGMGGDTSAFANSTMNGCAIAHECNWRLEQDPAFSEEGRRRGVKLEQGYSPVTTPMWSVFFRQWVVFDLLGMHLTGDTRADGDARLATVVTLREPASFEEPAEYGIEWRDAA